MLKKIGKGIYFFFYCCILSAAGVALVFLFMGYLNEPKPINVFPYLGAVFIALIAWYKIIMLGRRKLLYYSKFPMIKLRYLLLFLVELVILLVIAGFSAFFKGVEMLEIEQSGYNLDIVYICFNALVLFSGLIYMWTLLINTAFIGIRNYLRAWIHFIKSLCELILGIPTLLFCNFTGLWLRGCSARSECRRRDKFCSQWLFPLCNRIRKCHIARITRFAA